MTLPTSYVVTGLDSSGITYTFQVRAVSAVGGSDPAEVEATTTTTVTAPDQMSNVAYTVTGVTDGAGGTVTFTWNDPGVTTITGITGYQYRYDGATSDSDTWAQAWAAIPGDSATATATSGFSLPTSSLTVFFEFRAVNSTNSLNGLATAVMVPRQNTLTPPSTPAPALISPMTRPLPLIWCS